MKFASRLVILTVLLLSGRSFFSVNIVHAQDMRPRFGVGFGTMLSTSDGLGIGFRGRASAPVNSDISLAVDLGFTGFILGGRSDATYVFDPQASIIVNLPYRSHTLAYALFGIGGYIPVGNNIGDKINGPTLHLGIGWVHTLHDTALFYELNPAMIIGENGIDLAFPIRVGLIF